MSLRYMHVRPIAAARCLQQSICRYAQTPSLSAGSCGDPLEAGKRPPPTSPSTAVWDSAASKKDINTANVATALKAADHQGSRFFAFVSQGQPQAGAPSHVRACAWPATRACACACAFSCSCRFLLCGLEADRDCFSFSFFHSFSHQPFGIRNLLPVVPALALCHDAFLALLRILSAAIRSHSRLHLL